MALGLLMAAVGYWAVSAGGRWGVDTDLAMYAGRPAPASIAWLSPGNQRWLLVQLLPNEQLWIAVCGVGLLILALGVMAFIRKMR